MYATTPAKDVFDDMDLNEDGKISLDEASSHLKLRKTHHSLTKRDIETGSSFYKLDTNNNGFIDPGEFDSDLK